jgi:hypothetical protein
VRHAQRVGSPTNREHVDAWMDAAHADVRGGEHDQASPVAPGDGDVHVHEPQQVSLKPPPLYARPQWR